MVSLWCELLCKRSIYTMKSDQWITLYGEQNLSWSTTNIPLLQFKIQSHLQKRGL